jgi:hypothetical protein
MVAAMRRHYMYMHLLSSGKSRDRLRRRAMGLNVEEISRCHVHFAIDAASAGACFLSAQIVRNNLQLGRSFVCSV